MTHIKQEIFNRHTCVQICRCLPIVRFHKTQTSLNTKRWLFIPNVCFWTSSTRIILACRSLLGQGLTNLTENHPKLVSLRSCHTETKEEKRLQPKQNGTPIDCVCLRRPSIANFKGNHNRKGFRYPHKWRVFLFCEELFRVIVLFQDGNYRPCGYAMENWPWDISVLEKNHHHHQEMLLDLICIGVQMSLVLINSSPTINERKNRFLQPVLVGGFVDNGTFVKLLFLRFCLNPRWSDICLFLSRGLCSSLLQNVLPVKKLRWEFRCSDFSVWWQKSSCWFAPSMPKLKHDSGVV